MNDINNDVDNIDEIILSLVNTGKLKCVKFDTLMLILLQLNEYDINTLMVQQDKDKNYWIKVDDKTVKAYKHNLELSNVEENNV